MELLGFLALEAMRELDGSDRCTQELLPVGVGHGFVHVLGEQDVNDARVGGAPIEEIIREPLEVVGEHGTHGETVEHLCADLLGRPWFGVRARHVLEPARTLRTTADDLPDVRVVSGEDAQKEFGVCLENAGHGVSLVVGTFCPQGGVRGRRDTSAPAVTHAGQTPFVNEGDPLWRRTDRGRPGHLVHATAGCVSCDPCGRRGFRARPARRCGGVRCAGLRGVDGQSHW